MKTTSVNTSGVTEGLTESLVPYYCRGTTLVLGCGNLLFGDDGFGPSVVEHLLQCYDVPREVVVMDVGTGVREVLMDIVLSDTKPQQLVIVDAMESSREPGTIRVLTPDDMPQVRTATFSPHQVPTSLLLKELEQMGGVEVTLLTVQPHPLPSEVQPGLSPEVRAAIPAACEMLARRFFHA